MCFNVDGKLAAELITGAVDQQNWEAEIRGKASHAGERRAGSRAWQASSGIDRPDTNDHFL